MERFAIWKMARWWAYFKRRFKLLGATPVLSLSPDKDDISLQTEADILTCRCYSSDVSIVVKTRLWPDTAVTQSVRRELFRSTVYDGKVIPQTQIVSQPSLHLYSTARSLLRRFWFKQGRRWSTWK